MAVSGKSAKIKKSGVATSVTDEAMSNTAGNTFQIDNLARQVFDKTSEPTFYEDSVEIATSDISSINYLYGKVTFSTAKSGDITADITYMPMSNVAMAKSFTMNKTQQIFEASTFDYDHNYITKKCGLKDVVITISRFDDNTRVYSGVLEAGTPVVLELAPDTNKSYRGWFLLDTEGIEVDLNALNEGSLNFTLAGDYMAGRTFSDSSQ